MFFVPGERMFTRKVIGFGIGFAGAVVLIGTHGLGVSSGPVETLARAACVTAAFSYAAGSIVTRLCPDVNELALSTAALMVAGAILVPLALLVEGLPEPPSAHGWLAICYLGLIPTGLAFIIKVAVIRSAGPSFMTLTNYMVPVWAIVFGSFLLGETLPPRLYAALALILLGLAVVQWGTWRRVFTK